MTWKHWVFLFAVGAVIYWTLWELEQKAKAAKKAVVGAVKTTANAISDSVLPSADSASPLQRAINPLGSAESDALDAVAYAWGWFSTLPEQIRAKQGAK